MRYLVKGLIILLFVMTGVIPQSAVGYAKEGLARNSANSPRLVVFEAFMHDT